MTLDEFLRSRVRQMIAEEIARVDESDIASTLLDQVRLLKARRDERVQT